MHYIRGHNDLATALGITDNRRKLLNVWIHHYIEELPQTFSTDDLYAALAQHVNTPEEGFYCGHAVRTAVAIVEAKRTLIGALDLLFTTITKPPEKLKSHGLQSGL